VRVIKSRRMRWAGHVARMGEERGVYRVLVRKSEWKRPLGRPRRRWVDNIRMGLQEVGCGYMDWTGLAQETDRWRTLVSVEMNLRVPWNAGNFLTSCKLVSCSRRTLHRGVSESYTLLRRGTFSSICIIQQTARRSRWKFRICICTMIILCIVFLYIHFCDLKMAHSGRNMSSSA